MTCSQANSSTLGSSRRSPSISVTSAPSERYACASSVPNTPPPRITIASGTCLAVVASRLVHGSASRRPSIGGSSAREPPARIDGLARLELVVADVDALLAGEHAEAAVELDALVLEPRQLAAVVEVVDDLVAAVEHGLDVELAGHRLGGAGDAAHLAQDLLGRSSAFDGMQA